MAGIKGSGNKVSESREVGGFDGVELAGAGSLYVRQTGTESISVEGDDNVVPHVITEVRDGTLVIRMEDGVSVNPSVPLVYNVTVRDISSLGLSGAGNVEANDLKTRDFKLKLSGAGHVMLGNFAGETLDLSVSGAGDVTVSGMVGSQKVAISGAGRYKADDLRSDTANVVTSGVGSASVWVNNTLNATISGVGSIQFYGNPTVEAQRSGMGHITRMGDKWSQPEMPEYGA